MVVIKLEGHHLWDFKPTCIHDTPVRPFIGESASCALFEGASLNKAPQELKVIFYAPNKVSFFCLQIFINGTVIKAFMVHVVTLRWFIHIMPSCLVCTFCPHDVPLAFSIIHGSGRAWKTGSTNHMSDVKWTQGGRRESGAQLQVWAQWTWELTGVTGNLIARKYHRGIHISLEILSLSVISPTGNSIAHGKT